MVVFVASLLLSGKHFEHLKDSVFVEALGCFENQVTFVKVNARCESSWRVASLEVQNLVSFL